MTTSTLEQLYRTHDGRMACRRSTHLDEYERLFGAARLTPLALLELWPRDSDALAGSLEIWAAYFPNALSLVGSGAGLGVVQPGFDDARVHLVAGAATHPDVQLALRRYAACFDIVIDVGPHSARSVLQNFAACMPLLAAGGVYVIEGLQSSYQQRYDGGLYAPYSALAFFKRLVDVVGHEHWGIERTHEAVLSGFFEQYGISIANSVLGEIESVAFVSGLCVVRKARAARAAPRMLAAGGQVAYPAGRRPPYETPVRMARAYEQSSNPWSLLDVAPCEGWQDSVHARVAAEATVQRLLQVVAERDAHITALYNSTSWRVSRPLRVVSALTQRLTRTARRLPAAIQRGGGVGATLSLAYQRYRRDGLAGLCAATALVVQPADTGRNDYAAWLRRYSMPDAPARQQMDLNITAFPLQPTISVIMPVYNSPLGFLDQAIRSVRQQRYPHWELCIADDASTDAALRALLERHRAEEPRIKLVYRDSNGHISAASNSALSLASGAYIALLDHDDLLDEQALYWMAEAINRHPDAGLLYSDEDKVDAHNTRFDPYFKSDLNYELFLAQNMVCHLGVYRTALVRELGGFRAGYEGAQDYDLALRVYEQLAPQQVVHVPRVLYHWRAISGSTALGAGEKNYAAAAGRKAVAGHLARTGTAAQVVPAPDAPGLNRVIFPCPSPEPLVSIIIPTRDRADLLGMCLDTLIDLTTYSNYEVIIVDNGSVEKKTEQLFARLPADRFRVIRDDTPFNFSALNNGGASAARGSLLCLMNNDIEILSPDWLQEMVSFATRADVGCVGARLWYPDGRLQHGGVVLGIGGVAGHAHKYLLRGHSGYFGRAILHQAYSAVTAACLLLRREVFEQVGGLDEQLAIAFNDVDFCLRVRDAGYRNVWTPYAEMVHHESASRGEEDNPEKIARFGREIAFVEARWGEQLRTDPAYNPNLTLVHEDYSLAWPPRVNPL
jgi:GT2 family glycosyltransferase